MVSKSWTYKVGTGQIVSVRSLLVALGFGLLLAGCGNDDSNSSVAVEPAITEQPAVVVSEEAIDAQPVDSADVVESQQPQPEVVAEPAAAQANTQTATTSSEVSIDFVEGVHYTLVGSELSAQPEVVEFFSFNCIHCYTFSSTFNRLKAELNDEISVRSVHVDFLGNNGRDLTWAYAMMVVMGVEDQVKMPLFAAIHDNRARINRNSIADLFALHGVSSEDFESYSNSFAVSGMEARMRQATMQQRVRGTPTVIINGIYEVQRGAVRTPAEMAALARFLRDKDFS